MCRADGKFTRVQAPKLDIFVASTKSIKCPSYRESNKRSKEGQGPNLGVSFIEVSVL